MIKDIYDLKNFLERLDKRDFLFSQHFYDKSKDDRKYLSEELIISSLKDIKKLYGFQEQTYGSEKRYRIGIKQSSKYNLIIIAKVLGKNLYIITAWKSNRKWEKSTQK